MAGGARVAVLGATGCVGGGVCAAFSAGGHEVVAVARSRTSRVAPYRFVGMDVAAAPPHEIAGLLDTERVDVVVNAAGGWFATEEANHYHHVRLVRNLLEGAALTARRPRVVQVGSIHEYGPVPSGVPIDESVTPRPATTYAQTKLAGSQAVLDSDGVVLRAVNVCGPYATPVSFLGMVLGRLRALKRGERLELSIGDARRDFVDVRDLADAVVCAATAPVAGRAINIGRGEATPIREILDVLVSVAGFPPEVIEERAGPVASRGGDWTQADIRLAGRLLGWRPRIGLHDSLREMWAAA